MLREVIITLCNIASSKVRRKAASRKLNAMLDSAVDRFQNIRVKTNGLTDATDRFTFAANAVCNGKSNNNNDTVIQRDIIVLPPYCREA